MRGAGLAPGAPTAERLGHPLAISRRAVAWGAVGQAGDDRAAVVGIGADGDVERTSPRKGTPSFSASLRAPAVREHVGRPPQCGQRK